MRLRDPSPTSKPSGILRQSLAASRLWVENEWRSRVESPDMPVVFSSLPSDAQQIKTENQSPSGARFSLPWCALYITQLQERQGPYNPWLTQFVGIPVGYTPNHREQIVEKVRPVDVGIGVRFMTNNLEEALYFASMWVENQPNVVVDIQNKGTGHVVRINMDLGTGISMPTGGGTDEGDLVVETTMIVRTFSGTTDTLPTVKRISIQNSDNSHEFDVVLSRVRLSSDGTVTKEPLT